MKRRVIVVAVIISFFYNVFGQLAVPVFIDFQDMPDVSVETGVPPSESFTLMDLPSGYQQFSVYQATVTDPEIRVLRGRSIGTEKYGFVLPVIALKDAAHRLRFDAGFLKIGAFDIQPSTTMLQTGKDSVEVQISTETDPLVENYTTIYVISSVNQNLNYIEANGGVYASLAGYEVIIPDSYKSQNVYIRFRCKLTGGVFGSIITQFANFSVSEISACEAPYAPIVVKDSITVGGIKVQWEDYENDLTKWNLSVKSENDTVWSESFRVTSNPVWINSLKPQTKYQVRVQSVCSESELSAWSNASSGITTRYKAPFFCDFSNWMVVADGMGAYQSWWSSRMGTLSVTGDPFIPLSNDNVEWTAAKNERYPEMNFIRKGFTVNGNAMLYMPLTEILPDYSYKISFDIFYESNGSLSSNAYLALLQSKDNGQTFTGNDIIERWGTNGIPFLSLLDITHYEFLLDSSSSPLQLAFYLENTGAVESSINNIYITNIALEYAERPPCFGITGVVQTSNLLDTSIVVLWNREDVPFQYRFRYRSGYETQWREIVTKENTLFLGGLLPQTPYVCAVRAECSSELDDTSAWSNEKIFFTLPSLTVVNENDMLQQDMDIYISNGHLNVVNPENISVSGVEIFDVSGRKILDKKLRSKDNITLPLPGMSKGVWLIRISTEKGIIVKKVRLN
ncbi:MAG: fibronectin type III domain-containing protein [Bacteroidales bacterium]|jgi:hypothetical protein|nr:fibronectin type III domain-containing protein [Bacteroidales bacterium]